MTQKRLGSFLLFALLTAGVVIASLLAASYVIFAPGTTLTCHATFAISDAQPSATIGGQTFKIHLGVE